MSIFTRKSILDAMKVLPEIDADNEIKKRVEFIKHQIFRSQSSTLVLGISGGIDSATTGKLAQIAVDQLKEETDINYQFVAIRLPYGQQIDEDDAQLSLKFICPDKVLTINIHEGTQSLFSGVMDVLVKENLINYDDHDFAKGNVKARMRMIAQYQVVGILNGLVLGTDHSAENVTGCNTYRI
jgi:NAD+ synthase